MPHYSRHHGTAGLPPAFVHLIRALDHEAKRDPQLAIEGHAEALAALAQLAAMTVPARGVLVPSEEVCQEIDRIARKHLARKRAEQELRSALNRVGSFEKRDAIDVAHIQIVDITERMHYLTGLAFGIAWIEGASK